MSNVRKIDFGDRDWSAHAQDHWLAFAGNPRFPDYLRVVFTAYARHTANGHATLERGELAYFLIRKDGSLPERRVVWRAVQEAVKLGFLVEGSQLLCLIVSSHQVQGGKGSPTARCKRDHARRMIPGTLSTRTEEGRFTERNVGSDSRRSTTNVGNDARRSTTNVGNSCRRSVLGLSSLSSTSKTSPRPESA